MKSQVGIDVTDWTSLLQLDYSTISLKTAVVEEDMDLFYDNLRIEHISVLQEETQDSHFVTLAAEPATVLEASTFVGQSVTSERRLTAAQRFLFLLLFSIYLFAFKNFLKTVLDLLERVFLLVSPK